MKQTKTPLPKPTLQQLKELFEGKLVTESRSPAGIWLGFTLEQIEHGYAKASIPVRKEMTNPYGNIHGGMMAALMDEIIGWSVLSLEAQNHYTSLNLNVDFLYAAPEGTTLIAEAKVIRHGKKIVHVECSVSDREGRLMAKAASNLIAITASAFS